MQQESSREPDDAMHASLRSAQCVIDTSVQDPYISVFLSLNLHYVSLYPSSSNPGLLRERFDPGLACYSCFDFDDLSSFLSRCLVLLPVFATLGFCYTPRKEDDIMSDGGVLPVDVKEALQKVLKSALIADGLSRGLHEACKALDHRQAHFCVLASNCDEPQYVNLVKALCQKHEIPLIEVENKKDLGEWAGLFKMDKEMKARKVVGCSCAVVKDWGREDAARSVIQKFLSSRK